MKIFSKKHKNSFSSGQVAVEYLLLLGTVVAIVLIGFRTHLPRIYDSSEVYWNRVGTGIVGDPTPCGDGLCCFGENENVCPLDCPAGTSPGAAGCP